MSIVYAQPFLTYQRASFQCQLIAGIPTSFHGTGFVRSKGTGFGSRSMQFVIKPNSTAFVKIDYLLGTTSAQAIYSDRNALFVPIQYWYGLGNTGSNSLTSAQIGLSAAPINETVTGNQTLSSTYEITATSSASPGTYSANFWSTCGPQLVITVGQDLYTGPGLTGGIYH